jgi:hypothetical protein
MYSYYSIIQKCVKKDGELLLLDKNMLCQNINEVIHLTHNNLFCNVERSENMSIEINKLNLYFFLATILKFNKTHNYSSFHFIGEKYKYVSSIYENIFFNDTNKDLFLTDFSKIQRVYFALSKFARMYKYKKSSVKINTDLYMNELDENMKNVFVLYEDNAKYLFSVTDLVNIINSSLSHTYSFFSEPLKPKNPYNNLSFNKSTLYNIYFFMKKCEFIMPQLFEQYFICNFDIKLFKYENECLIREFSIKRYIYSSNYDTLYDNVIIMIGDLKKRNKKYKNFMNIHDDFPQQKLVDIMRPYLHLYYLSKYYVAGTEKKNDSMRKLENKFDLFVRFNPQFGRKVVKITRIPRKKMTIEYNDNHMNFYKQYPKSAFPRLPVVVDINRNVYESPDPNDNDIFIRSLFERVTNRVNHFHSIRTRTESIFISSDGEEEENEEEEEEENEEEEDTSDDTDSLS